MQQIENGLTADEISSGFSDLLYEFKDRTRTPTNVENIVLKFRTSDIYLYTYEDGTEFMMMLAVYNRFQGTWRYFLKSGTPARKLVRFFCEKHGYEDVVNRLDVEFKKYRKSKQKGAC